MNAHSTLKKNFQQFACTVFILLIIGLVFVYSSSSVYALEHYGSSFYYLKKQFFGIALGLVAVIILGLVPLPLIKRLTPYSFVACTLLTALTLMPSLSFKIHGSARWLYFAGLNFQPSELLKVSFILYVAYYIEKHQFKRNSFFKDYFPLIVILGITSIVLLFQPDFGLTVTLCVTTLLLMYIARFKSKHLGVTLLALAPACIGLIALKPYRLKRILIFLNPWHDPTGSGFQVIQSLIAVGSGGLAGSGIAQSKQKFFYLPMQHTDFIFSIIAEESGFIGASFLIFLYILFLHKGIQLALAMQSTFSCFATMGFTLLISLQAIINMSVATGLAPTKGIGLPFISYGNTSLTCAIIMVGLIMNMARAERA